jgi:hypothetical protein
MVPFFNHYMIESEIRIPIGEWMYVHAVVCYVAPIGIGIKSGQTSRLDIWCLHSYL